LATELEAALRYLQMNSSAVLAAVFVTMLLGMEDPST
jgi:hypothetical protein